MIRRVTQRYESYLQLYQRYASLRYIAVAKGRPNIWNYFPFVKCIELAKRSSVFTVLLIPMTR